MRCLIDCDVLNYQCSFAGQFKDELTGEVIMKDFDYVAEDLAYKVKEITEECMSDEPPLMFLTEDSDSVFRHKLAKTLPYKGNRDSRKPKHFYNTVAYVRSEFDCVSGYGLEADDLLAIYATRDPTNSVICSVDKDLRQVPTNHYTWSVGKRESKPMEWIDELGYIELDAKGKPIMGGLKALFAQALMGDRVDNIRGVEGLGPVKAYNLLHDLSTEGECFDVVKEQYIAKYPDNWENLLREAFDLVYIIRELDLDGEPVLYKYPKERSASQDQVDQRQGVEVHGQKQNTETS